MSLPSPVIQVRDLCTYFPTARGLVKAVDGVSFELHAGHTLAIVGESGSGKTQLALSIVNLLEDPGEIVGGEVLFGGRDLTKLGRDELEEIRGKGIAMVFQDPLSSINPVYTVGNQIVEAVRRHQSMPKARAWKICEELLDEVEIPEPRKRARQYQHELSGGMRQRVMIAMAIANKPDLLIADEPTTALDVTVQAQILDLLTRLQREHGMALILITHDLGIVAGMADEVQIMYAGHQIEIGTTEDVFYRPQHPYTMGLLASLPRLDRPQEELKPIPGAPPRFTALASGCHFNPRCAWRRQECVDRYPVMKGPTDHPAACVLNDAERAAAAQQLIGSRLARGAG